jgi:hypothetical protein
MFVVRLPLPLCKQTPPIAIGVGLFSQFHQKPAKSDFTADRRGVIFADDAARCRERFANRPVP